MACNGPSTESSYNVQIKNETVDNYEGSQPCIQLKKEEDLIINDSCNRNCLDKLGPSTEDSCNVQIKNEAVDNYEVKSCYMWFQENLEPQLLEEPNASLQDNDALIGKKTKSVSSTNSQGCKKNNEELLKQKFANSSKEPHNKQMKSITDEFEAVGIIWASKLKKLEETQRVLADDLINQILNKGFFKELTKNTVIYKVS